MPKPLPTHLYDQDEQLVELPTKPHQAAFLGTPREQLLEEQLRFAADLNKKMLTKLRWWRRGTDKLMERLAEYEHAEAAPKKKAVSRRGKR